MNKCTHLLLILGHVWPTSIFVYNYEKHDCNAVRHNCINGNNVACSHQLNKLLKTGNNCKKYGVDLDLLRNTYLNNDVHINNTRSNRSSNFSNNKNSTYATENHRNQCLRKEISNNMYINRGFK